MEVWHIWIIAGLILLVVEIFTPGFVVGSFGAACFFAALTAFMGLGAASQLGAFSVATLVFFFGVRPFYQKYLQRFDDPARLGVERILGASAVVVEPINNAENAGRIKVQGELWKAASLGDESIAAGTTVVVKKIEGVTAYVVQQKPGA